MIDNDLDSRPKIISSKRNGRSALHVPVRTIPTAYLFQTCKKIYYRMVDALFSISKAGAEYSK